MLDTTTLLMELAGMLTFLAFAGSTPPGPYEKIYFKRDGGGNKAFYVSADEAKQKLSFSVVKYDFKDTSYTFDHSPKEKDNVCGLITSILSGRSNVVGDAQQPSKPVGTWVHLYAVTAGDSLVEITDKDIRNRLMILEKYVEAQRVPSPR